MSQVQELKVFVNQRLSAAAEEIFELFERTILEYEEKLCGSKENQHKLQDTIYNPEVRLHRADIQHLLKSKEEPPHQQQKRSPRLNQENPLQIKEELWSSQEEGQLGGLVEAGINTQIFTPVPLKGGEEDKEEPQSSQFHEHQTEEKRDTEHLKTVTHGKDCSGSDLERNLNPDCLFHPDFQEEALSSESHTDDSSGWEETSETQTGVDPLRDKEMPQSGEKEDSRKTSAKSFKCATKAGKIKQKKKHNSVQRQEKPVIFTTVCSERSINESSLSAHTASHTKCYPYSCSFCKKSFPLRLDLLRHLRIHAGEKPFICSECGKGFTLRSKLRRHQQNHTEEKPFSCSDCGTSFSMGSQLRRHQIIHTGEKPFSCSECGRSFALRSGLYRHELIHSTEKPHKCSVCLAGFRQRAHLMRHIRTHTGEKPFSCSVCRKTFSALRSLKRHLIVHTTQQ